MNDLDLTPSINKIYNRTWVNKVCTNELYKITEDEYVRLPNVIKQRYKYDDINKNGFFVDYLFNELITSTSNTGIIKSDMIKSFLKLVIQTSIC